MKLMRVLTVVLLLVCSGALLGCGGGGADVKQSTTTTTLGKELQDLDDAYKKGTPERKGIQGRQEKSDEEIRRLGRANAGVIQSARCSKQYTL